MVHKQQKNQAGAETGVKNSVKTQDKDEHLGTMVGTVREEPGQASLVSVFDMRNYRRTEIHLRVQKDFPVGSSYRKFNMR